MLGGLTGYIMSIVGVMLMSVIVDILLSEHAISKYVKSFMALIIVFVIISPVVKYKNGLLDFNFNNFFQSESVDTDLALKLNEKKKTEIEKSVTNKAEEKGIKNLLVTVYIEKDNPEFKIKKIEILSSGVLSSKNKEIITEIIRSTISVSLSQIVFL